MRKHFDSPKGINNLNKDPDNLLVQWVPGGKTMTEILEANRVKAVRVWEY